MQLIRFLVLVNSCTDRSSYSSRVFSFLFLIVILFSPSRLMNSYPNYLAAFTSASSSGELELYVPFLSSMMMVWQAARKMITLTRESLSSELVDECKVEVSLGSWKFTFYSCFVSGFSPVPYASVPAVNFLNSITLLVSVPVLSEKMYSICPNSSLRLLA